MTLYRRKYVRPVPWILEGREMCPIPLGRVRLHSHLKGRLDVQGLRGVVLDCSSFWSIEICFLNYPPLQMKVWRTRSLSFFTLNILRRITSPLFLFSLVFGPFFFFLSSCVIICLRVSIDSYWAWIILNYSLWTWACSSNRLAIFSGVPAMYAKASFSVEELEACDFAMAGCTSFTSTPLARAL